MEVTLLRTSIAKVAEGVKDQSEALKQVQINKFYPEAYAKYQEELKDLGVKEANPPLP